jgi:hypothetical protein
VATAASASLVAGTSVKAARELDWEAPRAQHQALTLVLEALKAVEHGLARQPPQVVAVPGVSASLVAAQQVRTCATACVIWIVGCGGR